jgi:colicin import membrane protein
MAEKESSVLFSLKELRNIEDDRVKQEEEAARAKVAAEVKAREDAARRAREAEEHKAREDQERMHRLQIEKERQLREAELRAEGEKHKAQLDAQARLEEARIQAEIQAKAHAKKPPVGAIVGGVVGVVVLAGAVLGYVLGVYMPAREAAREKEFAAQQELAIKHAVQKAKDDLSAEYDAKISNEKDEAKKALLIAEKKAKQDAQEAAIRSKVSSRTKGSGAAGVTAPPKPKKVGETKCKDPNDPLCGTDL